MHYKNSMPPFHPLSMEGGRKRQEVISYTVYSNNGKKPIHKKEQSLIMSLSLPQIWQLILSLSPQSTVKKPSNLFEKGICLTTSLPFIVSRIKQASSWKFCIIWKKQEVLLIIKTLVCYIYFACVFIILDISEE